MGSKRKVLVTGATGQQGGAVVSALISRGHEVRGMARDPDSPAARNLVKKGVEVVKGVFSKPDTLVQAASGVDTMYAMTTPFEAGVDVEVEQGKALVDAAVKAGIGHFILGSVASADAKTGVPHFESKYAVEKYLAASGLHYSISAPVFFIENLLAPWALPELQKGAIAQALPGGRPLQQIATRNIGEFVTALAERRESVFGQRYDIAGDELTGEREATLLSEATGKNISYKGFPADYLREQSEDMALMFEWIDSVGYSANIDQLRKDFSEVNWLRFEDWAKDQDWSILEKV